MDPKKISACVGVGASAGGLNALRSLLQSFSIDDGLCVVIVQHLEPNHESLLADILSRDTRLDVAEAVDGQELSANTVLTIPPNNYIAIKDGHVKLSEFPEDRLSRMPVDHLLSSLAEEYAGRAIGVVLTGTGSDGTGGIRAIRGFGGLTIAQDPEEAEYDGMPKSAIHSGSVDQVLPIGEMPEAIRFFVRNRDERAAGSDSAVETDLDRILDRVQQSVGYDFREYKASTIRRRVQRRMGLVRVDTTTEYIKLLDGNEDELDRLKRDLLISVTRFFRDPEAFSTLKRTVETLLEERSDNPNENVRAWVPGCATGEEAYAIAITLLEAVRELDVSVRVQVFGSDVDPRALHVARTGRYGGYIRGHVPEHYLNRYFIADDEGYRVTPSLRETVLFSPQNVLSDPPFSGLDLISCRNLLIYLNRDVHDRIISLFHFSLRERGILFLGNAETIGENDRLFRSVDRPRRVYRKRPEADARLGHRRSERSSQDTESAPAAGTPQPDQSYPQRATERALAEWFGPPAVTVDADGHVQFLHGEVNHFLQFQPGEPRYHINKLLRPGLSARVLAAIRSIRAGSDWLDEIVHYSDGDVWRVVRLVVRPIDPSSGLILVAFQPQPSRTSPEQAASGEGPERDIIRSLERELESTRSELRDTVEDKESSNEELRASNEEILSMNEELQSTNEELETSKEELQSLSEEFGTVNAELEEQVEQVEQTNRDLENLLESSELAIVFFDEELRLGRYSARAGQLFGLLGTDSGRRIGDMPSRMQELVSLDILTHALDGEYTQQELRDRGRKWYLLRCLPYRRRDGSVVGAVVTVTDVTELHEAKDQVASLLHRYRSLTENSTDIIVRFDRNYRHIFINKHISNVVELTPEDYIGKSNRELGFDPEICEFWEERIDAAFRTGEPQRVEFSIADKEGRERVFDWKVIREEGEESVLAVARDITDLAEARRGLERALADREVLIRDVHHRVKNNLFLLVGLLIMEREQLRKTVEDSEPVMRSLNKIMGRIQVISSIYEYLYQSAGRAEWVDAPAFVEGLAELVQAAYEERDVTLSVAVDDYRLPVDTAIPVGLMINEILTNAYKHAFSEGESGTIEISMTQTANGNEATLTVHDNGLGIDAGRVENAKSVGTTLIDTLASQIDGAVTRENADGTRVTVRFPLEHQNEEE